ncbi:Zn-dependent hydrolase [Rhodoligotrophos defluvii]|uniref:Zn-dependent hydrolase n=1 Tax=Rhodoligotrophos defluvii TaxID=2561934 RepID=UPI0010C9C04F|nr:Zn-dependent hydrolase [Rhodoligotrophos defluvii]
MLTVDMDLARRLFETLAEKTQDPPGITRAAYGAGEEFAHGLVRQVGRDLGLVQAVDAAGNLYLTLPGRQPELPQWIIGSHLDSVPHGGNYDGAAGVIAGLCTIAALKHAGIDPHRSITVMVIRAEESTWFPISYLGSRAAFGLLPGELLDTPRSDTGLSLYVHMAELGLRPDAVRQGEAHLNPEHIHGFIEVHIEQGPVLEMADKPLGLVTGIAGSFRYRTGRCIGSYGHSGAVPRPYRQDAVVALAELITGMDEIWAKQLAAGRHATVTFGEVGTDPEMHAFSKVPGEARFCLDVRSDRVETLNLLHAELMALGARIEQKRGVRFLWGERTGSTPAPLDPELRQGLAETATAEGIGFVEMASGAGHDTAVFANAGVKAALIFVRNQNGSHNPHEAMRLEDFEQACNLLTRFIALQEQ